MASWNRSIHVGSVVPKSRKAEAGGVTTGSDTVDLIGYPQPTAPRVRFPPQPQSQITRPSLSLWVSHRCIEPHVLSIDKTTAPGRGPGVSCKGGRRGQTTTRSWLGLRQLADVCHPSRNGKKGARGGGGLWGSRIVPPQRGFHPPYYFSYIFRRSTAPLVGRSGGVYAMIPAWIGPSHFGAGGPSFLHTPPRLALARSVDLGVPCVAQWGFRWH